MTLEAFITFLVSQMEGIRKSQIKTLAAIGRAMKNLVKPKHNIKRVDRFLGNARIDLLGMAGALFAMLINRLPTASRMLIAMDWIDLHDGRHQTLVLADIAGGRAIAVLWRTTDKNTLKDNQTKIEMDLLKDFRTIVPDGTEIVILADRGFGKIPLFDQAKRLKFGYVIRLKRNAHIFNKFYNGSLEKLVIKTGTLKDMDATLYTAKNRYPLRLKCEIQEMDFYSRIINI